MNQYTWETPESIELIEASAREHEKEQRLIFTLNELRRERNQMLSEFDWSRWADHAYHDEFFKRWPDIQKFLVVGEYEGRGVVDDNYPTDSRSSQTR